MSTTTTAEAPVATASRSAANAPILEVEHLQVEFVTRRGTVQAVRDVSFTIAEGETLGLVGESGSGKSVTAQALLGMIELPGRIVSGDVRWKGQSLVQGRGHRATIERVRGSEIAMVFQDPMTSLNPVFTIGSQMVEILRRHKKLDKKAAAKRSVELLEIVGISNPAQRVKQYPFEMSGGMRQRVLIAMALACEPQLLVADEPTTALDVTIQAQILDLVASLQRELNLAVLLITHDLGVVAGVCDRVAVMYAGKIIEDASAVDLYATPGHPYTAGLLSSTPRVDLVLDRLSSIGGAPPDMRQPPAGCGFAARCAYVIDRCTVETPVLQLFHSDADRQVACFRADEPEVSVALAASAAHISAAPAAPAAPATDAVDAVTADAVAADAVAADRDDAVAAEGALADSDQPTPALEDER